MKDLIQIMAVFAVILTIIPTIVFLRPNESESKPAFSEKEKIEIKSLRRGECLTFVGDEHILIKINASDFEKKIIEEKNN